jgi:DNA-binding MarR family transcriptional regulator
VPSPLEAHLGYWLRFVSNHVSQTFAARIEGAGATVAEWVALRELYDHEALAPSQLAERLGMTRGAISKLADRLEAKSLAVRTPDPDDHRYLSLALTPEGRALVPRLAALADINDAEAFGHLTPEQRALLVEILRGVVARLGLRSPPLQ